MGMLEAIETDLEDRRRNFGEDDVMLITRQTSTVFNVHCCSEDSANSVASALSAPEPPQESGKKPEAVCKVCMDQKPDIVLRQCNHGGLCETCLRKMFNERGQQRTCP